LLSSHPNIAISSKGSNMWTYFSGRYGDLSKCDNFERCLAAMLRYGHVQVLNPNPERIREEFWRGEPTCARLFALFHIHYAEQLGKLRWGDQSGLVECFADRILSAYPGAKMIHMVRDPRDRCAEAVNHRSSCREKVGVGTAKWLYSVSLAKRNQERHPHCYKIVRYETLVSQPEETLRDVCTFLNEDYIDRMLVIEGSISFRKAGGNRSDGNDGRGNVSTAFVGRYQQVMSKCEIAFVQAYAKRSMAAYGYELTPVRFSPRGYMRFCSIEHPVNVACMVSWRILQAIRQHFPAWMGAHPSCKSRDAALEVV
jgi:hypothetical protein